MQNVAVAVAVAAAVVILAVDVDVVLVALLLLWSLLRHTLPLPALMRLRLEPLLLLLELEAVALLVVQCSRAAVSTVAGSRVEAVNASVDWLIHRAIPKRNRSAATAALADCAPTPLGSQLE